MNSEQGIVLVVDDDPTIRHVLRSVLPHFNFGVIEAVSGEEALGLLSTTTCDAVLLDIQLPRLSGIEVCRIMRNNFPLLPIIILSVLTSEDDKVAALDAGADDYITKPFHTRELTARLRAAIRRNKMSNEEDAELSIGDIRLNPSRRLVMKKEQTIHLTKMEFELLHYLMAHAGVPIPHAILLKTIWGSEFSNKQEYLRTYVRSLRMKIEDDPANPHYLVTDSHFGYRFSNPDISDSKFESRSHHE